MCMLCPDSGRRTCRTGARGGHQVAVRLEQVLIEWPGTQQSRFRRHQDKHQHQGAHVLAHRDRAVQMVDVRNCRQLASQLPELGASLSDLLTLEVNARVREKERGKYV